jgi:hypothetical protein
MAFDLPLPSVYRTQRANAVAIALRVFAGRPDYFRQSPAALLHFLSAEFPPAYLEAGGDFLAGRPQHCQNLAVPMNQVHYLLSPVLPTRAEY